MAQPLVSVVVPAYNAAGRIRATLDSVYAQTYQAFEIVLINDGSSDTDQLEHAIQGYDDRLVYIKQENRGPSGARNTGIRQARGSYIACLDSDDCYRPDHLETLVAMVIRDPGLGLVWCDSLILRDGLSPVRGSTLEPQHPPVTLDKLLKEECGISTSATLISRQEMIAAGLFDERYRRCEDFDLWLRLLSRGSRMEYHPSVGVERRRLADGLSADSYLLRRARIEIYQKTLETLALSTEQQELIRYLVRRNEGKCQIDLVKRHLRESRYDEALAAAEKASALLNERKIRWVERGLRTAPRMLRWWMMAREDRKGSRKIAP